MRATIFIILIFLTGNLHCQNFNIKGTNSWENLISETRKNTTRNPCFPNTYIIKNKIREVETIHFKFDSAGKEVGKYYTGVTEYDTTGLIIKDSNNCFVCIYIYKKIKCKYSINCVNNCGIIDPGDVDIFSIRQIEDNRTYDQKTQLLNEHTIKNSEQVIRYTYDYNADMTIQRITKYKNGKKLSITEFNYKYYK